MALQPVPIERFAGLDLRASPGANTAIDMTNVTVAAGGESIRTRDGMALFAPVATNLVTYLTSWGGDVTARLMIAVMAGSSNNAVAIDGSGTITAIGSLSGVGLNNVSSQAIGTPSGDFLYLATGSGFARFDGTAWTFPGLPAGGTCLGLSAGDNRLAVANTSASFSRVQFSDPGAPETFGANNFVDLHPGDGERIVALVTWQNQLFAFKQTKFFVFYGTSPNVDGSPIFNFHTVETGVGCQYMTGAVAGTDGVYFLHRTGVYRTTGSFPQLISEPLDPFFRGQAHPYFAGGATFAQAQGGQGTFLTWAQGRLYCLLGTSDPVRTIKPFVWDPAANSWSLWDHANATSGNRINAFGEARTQLSQQGRVELVAAVGSAVYRFHPSLTTDAGQPISSNYRAAFTDLGAPTEKTVRGTIIDGSSSSGSVSWQWSREWGALQPARSVSLGSSLAQGRDWYATRGRLLSWQVSGSSPWQIQRVEPLLRGSRPAGIKTAA